MLLAIDMRGLIIFGTVLGAGIGLFLTSNWALANSLAPREEAGKYLRVVTLEDGETVHNAFFDRDFEELKP